MAEKLTEVLIVGGGIAGLTLAHAVLRRGLSVQVLESAEVIREVGAGIQIPPNAVKVLKALELDDAIMPQAFEPWSIEARMGRSGRAVFDIPLAAQSLCRWGAPYLHIHRADYITALLAELPRGIVQLGARVKRFSQDEQLATVTLETGEELRARHLIGADGIHSVIREQMHGADTPRFTGNVAWRAVVPLDRLGKNAPHPTACAWFGPGKHAVTYRIGEDGAFANFIGVVEREDWQEEGWSVEGTKAEALADFAQWHPTIVDLIAQAEMLYKWALFERHPLPSWIDGRMALMGDAAHAMLPFLAQGAAMAVEDAYVLAEALSRDDLASYQAKRLLRTTKVQAASRANMGLFHKRSLAAQLTTYGPMWLAGRIAPNLVHRRMDWLYGHDVTQ